MTGRRPFIVAVDGPAGAGKSTASRRLAARLAPGGLLVLGVHERLPPGDFGLEPAAGRLPVYRR